MASVLTFIRVRSCACLGQNGAGKTTTIRMLTSVLTPTRGTARISGFDVVKSPEQVRASVGVLTEQHGLYLRMTGLEYLDFFGKVYRLNEPPAADEAGNCWDILGWQMLQSTPLVNIRRACVRNWRLPAH